MTQSSNDVMCYRVAAEAVTAWAGPMQLAVQLQALLVTACKRQLARNCYIYAWYVFCTE